MQQSTDKYTGDAIEVCEYMEMEDRTEINEHIEVEHFEHLEDQDINEFVDKEPEEYEHDEGVWVY